MTRPTVVAGNWKMHGSQADARRLARAVADGAESSGPEVLLFPPFVHLSAVLDEVAQSPVAVGAQNVCDQEEGAYTGEISAVMLADLGCRDVLLGHSERRHVYGESDELIARKFALLHALTQQDPDRAPRPVLCVGETLEEREAGRTQDVIRRQLQPARDFPDAFPRARIAYEPVWAIGTGVAATPDLAQQVHADIRAQLQQELGPAAQETVILYGGSVNAGNAKDLFSMPDIDGGLVGGASLKAPEFLSICTAMRK